jgi:uncharacterized protein
VRTQRISLIRIQVLAALLLLVVVSAVGAARAESTLNEQLIKAAAFADLESVKNLLDQGADANAKPRDGFTPLMAAASGEYWSVVTVMPGNYQKITLVPAHGSGLGGRDKVATVLLENGADVNARDKDGRTALMFSAGIVQADLVALLLKHGADVNAQEKDGRTALVRAVGNAGVDVVNLLLEKGARVNVKDRQGWTALMRAASFGRYYIPDLSPLEKKKKPRTNTVLLNIQQAGQSRIAELVKLLKAHRAKVTLTIAAMLGDKEEVQRYLQSGHDVNERTVDGMTPLIGAASKGHMDVVSLLLDRGPEINARTMLGITPLVAASRTGEASLVALLLERGADANARDKLGDTALKVAKSFGHEEVVKVLETHGVKN